MTDDLVEQVADKLAEIYLLGGTDDEAARAIIPLVQAVERERCARVADDYAAKIEYDGSSAAAVQLHAIAAAIHAGDRP